MIDVRVKIEETAGLDPQILIKNLEQKFSSANIMRDLARIKTDILNYADAFINSYRKRDQIEHTDSYHRASARNNLVNALREGSKILYENNRVMLGIGDPNELTKNAPYWYVVNYGYRFDNKSAYVPPANYGYWGNSSNYKNKKGGTGYPIAMGIGGEAWHHLSGPKAGFKSWKLTPKKPISPMHYLEEMAKAFVVEIDLLEQKYKQELDASFTTARTSGKRIKK